MTDLLSTFEQEKKFKKVIENAAEKALRRAIFDNQGLQRILERSNELEKDIIKSVKKHSLSDRFAHEEITWGRKNYPECYKVKSIDVQVNILRQIVTLLGCPNGTFVGNSFPPGAEGWFVILKWQLLGETYHKAVEKILKILEEEHVGLFENQCPGRLGEKYLRQHEQTKNKLQLLAEKQKWEHEMLLVPAQFGLVHRGKSVRRAREVFLENEFGLGIFEVACMLLTHPERLVSFDNLWIDCPGDEYAPGGGNFFPHAPYFCLYDGQLRLNTVSISSTSSSSGPVSGFLPRP